MGIYSTNSNIITENQSAPEADMSYVGDVGAARALAESVQNDYALFEGLIGLDFGEVVYNKAVNESGSEEATEKLQEIQEAATGGFIDKIKQAVQTVWAKIRGLFDGFIKRVQSVLVRDNKKYVDMNKAGVLKKDLSKMNFTWRKPKQDVTKLSGKTEPYDAMVGFEAAMKKDVSKIEEEISTYSKDETKLDAYNTAFGTKSSEMNDVKADYMDLYFEEADEQEGLSSSELNEIMTSLINSKKEVDAAQKSKKSMDAAFSKTLSSLDKVRAKYVKVAPKGGEVDGEKMSGEDAAKASKAISLIYADCQLNNNATLAKAAADVAMLQFNIKQNRAVFTKAVVFNPKSVKESNEMLEAYGEASDYEFDVMVAAQ